MHSVASISWQSTLAQNKTILFLSIKSNCKVTFSSGFHIAVGNVKAVRVYLSTNRLTLQKKTENCNKSTICNLRLQLLRALLSCIRAQFITDRIPLLSYTIVGLYRFFIGILSLKIRRISLTNIYCSMKNLRN